MATAAKAKRAAATEEQRIPLVEAAMRIGCSWTQAWRLLIAGRLDGEKRGGRWFVSESSVERVRAAE